MSKEEYLQRNFFLNNVPSKYLLGILNRKKISSTQLRKIILEILGKEVDNPRLMIKNISRYKLVELFIKANILSLEEEKELFYQFRDSNNPIFYLYKYKKNPFNNISELINMVKKSFEKMEINNQGKFVKRSTDENTEITTILRFMDFKIVDTFIHNEQILEFKFEFLEKLSYLDSKYVPSYVYSLKFGLFWIDNVNNLVIIKCQVYRIVEAIINHLEKIFNTYFWKFNLQKNVVDKIFDFNEIIKISLASKRELDNSALETIIIIDKKYAEKLKDPIYKFLLSYERKMGTYFTNIEGFSNKLKINVAEVGKVSLIGKYIKLDKCREWLITVLIELMKIQESFLLSKDFRSFIRSVDYIGRTKLYNHLRIKKAQKKLYELVEKIISLKDNPAMESIEFLFPIDIAYYFQDYLLSVATLRCYESDCNAAIRCPNEDRISTEFTTFRKFGENNISIRCVKCNTEILTDTEIECINGHKQYLDKNGSISYLFNLDLKVELNKILKELEVGYQINNENEVFYIKENKLFRIETYDKLIYQWDELPSFERIPKLKDLDPIVAKTQSLNITQIFEKCKDYKGKCRNCHLLEDEDIICISKIFSKISNGQTHPHSGLEFGDLEFPQKFSDRTEILYGIVKSYKKPAAKSIEKLYDIPYGKLTVKKNDNLLEQFIEGCMNNLVNFILIILGRIIDTELKKLLIEIAKWQRKKLVIIEPQDLIPIFAYYFKNFNK